MAGQPKPREYWEAILKSKTARGDRKLRAKRILAGLCIECGACARGESRYCIRCQPLPKSSLVPRTCQNPTCKREFKGRKHSKGCSPYCRSAVYRLTVKELKPVVEAKPASELMDMAFIAYQRWLVAQHKRLSCSNPGTCWTESAICAWAGTNKQQWCKEWIEVQACEQAERVLEVPTATGWEGWQPSNAWNSAGGESD